MDVYQGRFQDNGACGYVLKPGFLRDLNTTFNARAVTRGPWWAPKRLSVRVWPDPELIGALGPPFPLSAIPEPLITHHLFSGHLRAATAKSQQE